MALIPPGDQRRAEHAE